MTLPLRVIAYLEQRGIPAAIIGGVALAVHGIARATLDVDLLVVDRSVLDPPFWTPWKSDAQPEVRVGDADDPLAGVVRVAEGAERVDVIVGKHAWQTQALQRRVHVNVAGDSLPAVDRADLILLKLFAGGPQDLVDVRLLLAADPGGALCSEVDSRIATLPVVVQRVWKRVKAET